MQIKHRDTRTYKSWVAMKQRCLNKNYTNYKNYGGRGIKVYERWMKFENFFEDMGEKPENKTLDRKNNDKGYCKNNCRWATRNEQDNNTRASHFLTYKGRVQTIKQWSEELDINYKALFARLKKGWSVEKALTIPIRYKKPKIESGVI